MYRINNFPTKYFEILIGILGHQNEILFHIGKKYFQQKFTQFFFLQECKISYWILKSFGIFVPIQLEISCRKVFFFYSGRKF